MTSGEFAERVKKIGKGYGISESCDRRQVDGRWGWIAVGLVLDHKIDAPDTRYREIFPTAFHLYESKEEAQRVALEGALKWAEEGCPELPSAYPKSP